jgi:hypothetical protein
MVLADVPLPSLAISSYWARVKHPWCHAVTDQCPAGVLYRVLAGKQSVGREECSQGATRGQNKPHM